MIASLVQQPHQRDIGHRADFVMDVCAAPLKELFKRLYLGMRHRIEEAEAESLSQRRTHTVEHRVSTRHFNPLCAAAGKEFSSGFDEVRIGGALGTFETA